MDISVPIVGFIFVCVIFPHLVKNKPQFYMAFAVVLVALVVDIVVNITAGTGNAGEGPAHPGLLRFFIVVRDVLWIVDLILLVLATGGLSLHQLSGEFKNAYEVMRRGETTPTVVIPKRDNPYARESEPVAPTTTPTPPTNPLGPTSPNSPTPDSGTNGSSIPLA